MFASQFMLPHSNHLPSPRSQSAKIPLIAPPVLAQLVAPKFRELVFPSWQTPAVPQIAVDEHGNALVTKDDIWTTG
ncbi:MAG TPA: hypothetical protein VMP01_22205 [Pirellulaceae bacterium]|nr:hypothetical protein [Pirellulaceae bacterium]